MIKKWHFIVLFATLAVVLIYRTVILPAAPGLSPLSPPSLQHWFGTDLNGQDVFFRTFLALGFEILTAGLVITSIWFFGLFFGSLISMTRQNHTREFLMNLLHFIATLPILLVALFLLIIFGAGYVNAVLILSMSMIPTQALFVYNQVESARQEEFLVAKKSYGIPMVSIYRSHLFPFISSRYNSYARSRLMEIIMMNLALSFLGLGIQEPNPSLGRMLFDGLGFMFSGWWLWVPNINIIVLVFLFFQNGSKYHARSPK